jgi:hypothetical protein
MSPFIDDNLEQTDDGTVRCRHCSQVLGDAAHQLRDARVRESAPAAAGPSVRENADRFADRVIVLRQSFCPQCLTQLQAEIVPADEPSSRHRTLGVSA